MGVRYYPRTPISTAASATRLGDTSGRGNYTPKVWGALAPPQTRHPLYVGGFPPPHPTPTEIIGNYKKI